MDLSLFATSPTNDRRFTAPYAPLTERIPIEAPCYRAQTELNHRYGQDFAMKPLPPLPHRRICERRPGSRRLDSNSRCILTRIRRVRTAEHLGDQSPSLQQRRAAMAPQLTLSLPPASREEEQRGTTRPTMIWLPDEQMWLIQDEVNQNANPYLWSYPTQRAHQYTRSEPSPERTAHFDFTPLEPFPNRAINHEEPPDEIRDQFLRLIGRQQDERLSPLFQEAIQAVPPMTDPSPSTPHFPYPTDRDWIPRNSYETEADRSRESSEFQSYHTANASLTEEPRGNSQASGGPISPEQGNIIAQNSRTSSWVEHRASGYVRLSRDHLWSPIITNASPAEEQMSVVSQISRGTAWGPWGYTATAAADDSVLEGPRSQATSERRFWADEPRSVVTQDEDTSWEVWARRIARPASAMN